MGLLVLTLVVWTPILVLTAVAARPTVESALGLVLIWLIIIATAVWAAVDSSRVGFRGYKSVFAVQPWVVGRCVLLLWAAVFPLYLSERSRLKAGLLPAADGPDAAVKLSATRVVVWSA